MSRRRDALTKLRAEGGQVKADFEGRVGGARDLEAETGRTALYEELRALSLDELYVRAGMSRLAGTGRFNRQELIAVAINFEKGVAPAGDLCRVPGVNSEQCNMTNTTMEDQGGTMTEVTTPTAESLMEGVGEAVPNAKGTYHRLRVGARTLGYADTRKDGFVLNVAAKATLGVPVKLEKALEPKGDRRVMHVSAKTEKTARALIEWLAKQS